MAAVIDFFWNAMAGMLPFVGAFALLALVVKRRRILAALRACRAEAQTNVLLWLFNGLVVTPLVILPVLAVEGFLGDFGLLADELERIPGWLAVALAIILIDLVAYWRHRLEHDPALWRFHATHHADTAMHWFSLQRKHPVSKVASLLLDSLLVIALGFPLWTVALAATLRSWWGYFIHADVEWTLGPLGAVLVSPAAHRLHHVRDEALMGANYGNTVTLWDRLFGTWRDPAPYLGCETGIAEGTRGFAGELKRPFEARYRRGGQAEDGAVAAGAS